ncbi:MAG: hypothetical protein JWM11_432 [Planctomycetaceae bacterium]|nr:hypothetical protein [Planctomycetaceae bacterium]
MRVIDCLINDQTYQLRLMKLYARFHQWNGEVTPEFETLFAEPPRVWIQRHGIFQQFSAFCGVCAIRMEFEI